jgi:membrane associated rhomboid family serine protease
MNKQQILNKIKKAYRHVVYYFMRLPKITRYLVLALIGSYILGQFVDLSFFILKNFGLGFNPIQLVTYAFIEHDFVYLLLSVLAIWLFGYQIEDYWGTKRFGIFVSTCIIGTAVFHLILGSYFAVGMSGLFFALLMAYAMMWPNREVYLLLPPIPVKAKYLLMIYAAIMFIRMLSGQGPFLSKVAYLGGPLCGYLLIQYWRNKPPFNHKNKPKKNEQKKKKPNHLHRIK